MSGLLRLAFRNTLRNTRRTLLTATTVTIGTAFAVLTLAFLGGIFGNMINEWTAVYGPIRVMTSAYAEREQLAPLHENIEDSAPVEARLMAVPGIALAAPMIRTGVIASATEEIGEDGTLLTGSSARWYKEILLPRTTLTAGRWLDADSEDEQVVLGAKVARDLDALVGTEILLMGVTQYGSMAPISAEVVGVISGNTSVDTQAFVTLDVARWMTDIPDGALEILVYPDAENDRSAMEALVGPLAVAAGDGLRVEGWSSRSMWVQLLPVVDGMSFILSGILIFVMGVAIFNTMTMSVLERTGEIGVLRAMGQSRAGAVASFLLESLLIGLVGGLFGAILGSVPALYFQVYGVEIGGDVLEEVGANYAMTATMHAQLTPGILLTAIGVGLATAALGAFFPSIRAASIPPHEAMRQR